MRTSNHIVILVGICGTGKSAVGLKVAQKLEVPFYDVDNLLVNKNEAKGSPDQKFLIDEWLAYVEELIATQLREKGCVISCSILKKEHRKRLTANIDSELDWVFMDDTFENVTQRLEKNGIHDRTVSGLKSDFQTLEVPKRALTVAMDSTRQEIVDTILKYLARKYG